MCECKKVLVVCQGVLWYDMKISNLCGRVGQPGALGWDEAGKKERRYEL